MFKYTRNVNTINFLNNHIEIFYSQYYSQKNNRSIGIFIKKSEYFFIGHFLTDVGRLTDLITTYNKNIIRFVNGNSVVNENRRDENSAVARILRIINEKPRPRVVRSQKFRRVREIARRENNKEK